MKPDCQISNRLCYFPSFDLFEIHFHGEYLSTRRVYLITIKNNLMSYRVIHCLFD